MRSTCGGRENEHAVDELCHSSGCARTACSAAKRCLGRRMNGQRNGVKPKPGSAKERASPLQEVGRAHGDPSSFQTRLAQVPALGGALVGLCSFGWAGPDCPHTGSCYAMVHMQDDGAVLRAPRSGV